MSFHPASNGLPTPGGTPFSNGSDADTPASYPNHSTSYTPVDGMTPISTNPSRKRSRDDTALSAAEADGSYFPSLADQVNTPAPIPEEPVYGEGMALLNPSTGQYISPESQTGTWYEEKALEQQQKEIPDFRPKLPSSRKSVRLSQASVPSVLSAPNPFTSSAPASPPKTATHPLVDAATLALGIGWSKIADDPDIQAAARGWAKYLENHYRHIHGAEILLKSEGLNAFLVGCQEGYYLFREDLLEGQLVGRTWEVTLCNLRGGPMLFEGEETLRAERTPGPEEMRQEMTDGNGHICNGNGNGNDDEGKVMMQNWADYDRLNGDASAMVDGGMDVD
jgi:hypothetical protein